MAFLVSASASVAFADADVTMTEGSPTDINTWAFAPATATINVGQTVTWTNNGAQAHTATADTGNAFDTGPIAAGDSKTITFDTPGTFTYHCTPHPWMKASITVAGAAAAPAPAAAPAAAPPAAQPAAAAPAAAAPAVSQALPTPTPFRFLTPTPVAARPATTTGATTTTTTGRTPNAGGIPDGLPIVLLATGAVALVAGMRVLRRGRSSA
jgi:plastocyanin